VTTKIRFVVATLAVALVLGACSVTVFIGALVDETVDATVYTGADLVAASVADSDTLGPSDEKVYRVRVGSTAFDALYIYLDADLELYVYDADGRRYASSSSRDFFGEGGSGIASTSTASLAPTDVGFDIACPGSCVLLPASFDDPLFVRVVNPGAGDASFALRTVLRDFEDSGEASANPVPIPTAASFEAATGALETLGDVDVFVAQDTGVLYFDGVLSSGIVYEACITDPLDPGQAPICLRSGESDLILVGEEVTVSAVNADDRAAASGFSKYFLDIDD
jgi:hypothetical protein